MRLSPPDVPKDPEGYDLAPYPGHSQWLESDGGEHVLWFRHSFGMEMPLHVFQSVYQPRKLPRKKGKEEEVGWYYFCRGGLINVGDGLSILHKAMEGILVLGEG
ncbi:hypothetical protein Adt_49399 [Abeliophyllum distichum]|uniref:Uncharacterized protein n=1 Tax=Abeliophyllum distichum TaxID=126358 RepID=A0ABD1NR99_9LAMI